MKIKCTNCKDIIEGDKKGTYISCKCGLVAIDETPYYVRVIGNQGDFEEITNVEDEVLNEVNNTRG